MAKKRTSGQRARMEIAGMFFLENFAKNKKKMSRTFRCGPSKAK
jgi:hypothetical protein